MSFLCSTKYGHKGEGRAAVASGVGGMVAGPDPWPNIRSHI